MDHFETLRNVAKSMVGKTEPDEQTIVSAVLAVIGVLERCVIALEVRGTNNHFHPPAGSVLRAQGDVVIIDPAVSIEK